MKISKEHYEELCGLLDAVVDKQTIPFTLQELQKIYSANKIGKDPKKRLRWDLWWAIEPDQRIALYDKMKEYDIQDKHIDTALCQYMRNKTKQQNA